MTLSRAQLSTSNQVLFWFLAVAELTHGSYITRRQDLSTSLLSSTVTSHAATSTTKITAVSDCHNHGTTVYCVAGPSEYEVILPTTATGSAAPQYTGCHNHGSELYCFGPGGEEVEVLTDAGESTSDDDSSSTDSSESSPTGGTNCHFHAGVEHCVGSEGENGAASATQCTRQEREYNIPLRIGLLFVILVTSFIGVAGPILLNRMLPGIVGPVFTVLKQFGTGVILSTAFVHLYTHATLMFTNECLTGIEYEGTTSAVVMAGIILSFIADYLCHRLTKTANSSTDAVTNVLVLEAGIVFHSLLIGLTLVVAGDSFFITLFVVILFHQMFEGIALGTRIASLNEQGLSRSESAEQSGVKSADSVAPRATHEPVPEGAFVVSLAKKMMMALVFALVTPMGMAIGIGVLKQFNGNDPSTLIALGTLDALSAGILVWVGVVEMLARDWILPGGELQHAGVVLTSLAGFGLLAGMILMSFLGKWA
ncbi:zinc/iron transporter protein [Thozetella sp. PMI_491]|nr:zinc/iron transporter protein [Thozetella sp. PMI_491]